jgi:hypothetical protein
MFTPAHIAAMKLATDQFDRSGYQHSTSEQLAMEMVFNKALFEKYAQVSTNSDLSVQEQTQQKQKLENLIDESRLRRVHIATEDVKQNQPERALMLTLRALQMGKIDQEQALPEIDMYVKKIVSADRLDLLAVKMSESLYQKVLKPETKEILDYVLKENHADMHHIEKMREKIRKIKTVDISQTQAKRSDLPRFSAYSKAIKRDSYS